MELFTGYTRAQRREIKRIEQEEIRKRNEELNRSNTGTMGESLFFCPVCKKMLTRSEGIFVERTKFKNKINDITGRWHCKEHGNKINEENSKKEQKYLDGIQNRKDIF